ncbi:MAG TPA: hypothetical protein VK878_09865 [Candidatus Deferrimicrobiaceae bacterium]|nr:hypothetical protein [Candidatus Deferrimicrobiaceae bacterium]
MSTTGRILVGIVVAVLLLAVAVLEVVSERVRVEPAITEPSPAHLADSGIWEESGFTRADPTELQRIVVLRSGRPAHTGPEP